MDPEIRAGLHKLLDRAIDKAPAEIGRVRELLSDIVDGTVRKAALLVIGKGALRCKADKAPLP